MTIRKTVHAGDRNHSCSGLFVLTSNQMSLT